ncbi:MAG: hypothetical protein NT163_06705 [Chlorobiales bacterium]|nr:hypothetical protein [Chlorobiales bacterium]
MQTIETVTPHQAAPAIQQRQQKTLSTEGAILYFQEVHGLKIARATLYKKKSTQPDTFPGRRSPFGKLVFDPVEIDRYMLTGSARAAVETEGGRA